MEQVTKKQRKSLSFLRVERNTHRTLFSGIAKMRIGGCLRFDAGEWKGKAHLSQVLGNKVARHKDFKGKRFSARRTADRKEWIVERVK